DDLVQGEVLDARKAAEQTMRELFRPSMLGLYADAGAILCVMLTPIPLLHKVAIVGALWVMSIAVSAVFVTPALLSYIRRPQGHVHPLNLDGFMRAILAGAKWMVRSRARYWVAPVTLVAL